MSSQTSILKRRPGVRAPAATSDYLLRQAILKLLAVKDSDIRLLTLEQCRDAVDKSLHAGGAFSATIPLVTLFYGGFIDVDVVDPTRRGQDLFVLSKGHAVAALASIYAELGYFDRSVLANSRSYSSILNGHPGPILPGIQIATGPMGQGLSVAQGFAIAGRMSPRFDSYVVCGDGELQEGPIWEAVMFAGQKHLDNLCVMVDRNNGQLDMANRMIFPMPELEAVFASFNWEVASVDATQYDGMYAALERFRFGPRNGRPTAIICHGMKGHGALSDFLNKHKVTVPDRLIEQEMTLQKEQRQNRVDEFASFYDGLATQAGGGELQAMLVELAAEMRLDLRKSSSGPLSLSQVLGPVVTTRVPPRDKRIQYDAAQLPKIDRSKEYAASDIVTSAMKVFARDARVVSIDADLATTSGLEAGVAAVDQRRALNVGVAEANMMNIGEAFAALGHNTWISTFCPFYDWKVLRRIAVGHQERHEAIDAPDGWLSEGHGLDLTMLATAANFETTYERRDPHGERRLDDVRRRGPSENHRRLVPAADAGRDAVDHGRQPRHAVRTGDAHAVRGALRRGLYLRVRQGPFRPRREGRRCVHRDERTRRARGDRRGASAGGAGDYGRGRGSAVDRRGIADRALLVGKTCLCGGAEQRVHSREPPEGRLRRAPAIWPESPSEGARHQHAGPRRPAALHSLGHV